jgi:hypothetical protein
MRQLKTGVSVLAAAALMSLIGSGTAAATSIWSSGLERPVGTELKLSLVSGGTANRTDTAGNPIGTCSSVEFVGKTGQETAAAISIPLGITWAGCTNATKTLKGGNLTISHIAGTTNGTVTSDTAEWTLNVFGVSCVYGTGVRTDLGTLVGSTTKTATLNINVIINEIGSQFLCPDTSKWVANFQVTGPDPVHVEA